jgi:hypothetical protein
MSRNSGFFTGTTYDKCAYDKKLQESTTPFEYQMFDGKYENCNRCIDKKMYKRGDVQIVDVESDLWNLTRKASKCPNKMYNPHCKKSKECISTYDKTAPIVLAPEVCPIIKTNMQRITNTGYRMPPPSNCKGVQATTANTQFRNGIGTYYK